MFSLNGTKVSVDFCPCLYYSRDSILTHAHATGNKPPPLRRTRRRSLSSWQVQPQCRLLSRLSPELRLMIWEDVLGGLRLHIIQRSGQRLGHVVCPLSATTGSDRTRRRADTHHFCGICTGAGIPQPVKEGDLARGRHGDMSLGLALTCRQMYESLHPAHHCTHLLSPKLGLGIFSLCLGNGFTFVLAF